MHAYYVGENSDWIANISHCLDCHVITFNNPIKTILCINEQSKKEVSPTYIFIESYNKIRNLQWLNAIHQSNLKNTYLLLLSEQIVKEDIADYLHSGASEIVNINTTPEDLQITLNFLPRLKQYSTSKLRGSSQRFKLPWWKRAFDILFSGTAIMCFSPFLILTAAAIRLESKGPVIYKSKRVGSNYDIFDFLKFRSMYMDADKRLKEFEALNQYREENREHPTALTPLPDSCPTDETLLVADDFITTEHQLLKTRRKQQQNAFVKFENDPRITKVGRFIRKYSIDELPQLINILKGDMSIVGNRPLPLYEAELLTTDEYIERFMAPAGLTGLWQVEKRGNQGALSAEERKQLDIKYARNFSFGTDIKIICKTFTAFVQKENV